MHPIRIWGIPALLGVACLLLGGCGTEAPTSPDEFQASWDSLQFSRQSPADTLCVLGNGNLAYRSGEFSLAGVIAAGTLRAVEQAIADARLQPLAVPENLSEAGGVLAVVREGVWTGFFWNDPVELDAARRRLVDLLDPIVDGARSEATGVGNERVEWVAASPVASGERARVRERGARVIRDADALLLALREWMGPDPVVLPDVDFDSEMLLAVFAGEQPAGTEVAVGELASRMIGGYLQVPVTLHRPKDGCAGEGLASPYQIVRLRKMDLEVFFSWDVVEFDCLGEIVRRPTWAGQEAGRVPAQGVRSPASLH